jgi:hypothetical protein
MSKSEHFGCVEIPLTKSTKRYISVRQRIDRNELEALLIRSSENRESLPKAIPFCFSKLLDLGNEIEQKNITDRQMPTPFDFLKSELN